MRFFALIYAVAALATNDGKKPTYTPETKTLTWGKNPTENGDKEDNTYVFKGTNTEDEAYMRKIFLKDETLSPLWEQNLRSKENLNWKGCIKENSDTPAEVYGNLKFCVMDPTSSKLSGVDEVFADQVTDVLSKPYLFKDDKREKSDSFFVQNSGPCQSGGPDPFQFRSCMVVRKKLAKQQLADMIHKDAALIPRSNETRVLARRIQHNVILPGASTSVRVLAFIKAVCGWPLHVVRQFTFALRVPGNELWKMGNRHMLGPLTDKIFGVACYGLAVVCFSLPVWILIKLVKHYLKPKQDIKIRNFVIIPRYEESDKEHVHKHEKKHEHEHGPDCKGHEHEHEDKKASLEETVKDIKDAIKEGDMEDLTDALEDSSWVTRVIGIIVVAVVILGSVVGYLVCKNKKLDEEERREL